MGYFLPLETQGRQLKEGKMAMNRLLKTATSSPKNLLMDYRFWSSEYQFLLRLMISILLVVVVFIATYPESRRPMDIFIAWGAMLFHCLTIWGIVTALKVMAKIKVEHAIADYVDIKATAELRKIQKGVKDRIFLDRIGIEVLPDNESEEELSMIRIFKQILKEARDRKFDSSVNVMETYKEEAIGDIFKLQSVQRIALQLGILGTFIGLMMALEKIALDAPDKIITQLSSALKISFGTSVAGLEVSVILWLFITLIRRKQESYFRSMENSTVTMISLARNAINTDEFIAEISQIKKYMEELGNRIYDQSKKIQGQSLEIHTGMEKLAEAKSHFNEFMKDISGSQIKFVEEINKVYNIFSPSRISNELKSKLDSAVENISETFKTNLGQASGKLVDLNDSLSLLNEALKNIEKQIQEQAKQIENGEKRASEVKIEFYESAKRVNDTQQKFIVDIKNLLMEGNIEKLNQELEKFNNLVQKMNRKQVIAKINFEVKSEIVRFFSKLFKSSSSKHLKKNKMKN
jgi:biopolymer transport protein ExbB/TolQ